MERRNPLRSLLDAVAATLSVVVVMALGLLTVQPVPAGAAERRRIAVENLAIATCLLHAEHIVVARHRREIERDDELNTPMREQ